MFLYLLDSDTHLSAVSPIIITCAHNARVRAKWSAFYVSKNKKRRRAQNSPPFITIIISQAFCRGMRTQTESVP